MASFLPPAAKGRRYADQNQASEAFNLMIQKMTAAEKGPFFHLMPLNKYGNHVYFTLGMGASHYIYLSGRYLLWFQTYQSFGDKLPPQLLKFYPVQIIGSVTRLLLVRCRHPASRTRTKLYTV